MKPVGYLVNRQKGLSGERGLYYNYILAANGLFIEAENPLISARVMISECEIRGLAPMENKIDLTYGKMPQHLFDLALDSFLASPGEEQYIAVVGSDGYSLSVPVQDKEGGRVVYEVKDSVVLEMHSHAHMSAFFSPKDNEDEKGLKISAVVGRLNATPELNLRISVYGYFFPLVWGDIFDGTLTGAKEFNEWEVITEGDIRGIPEGDATRLQHPSRRLRRHRWFCGGGLMPPIEW